MEKEKKEKMNQRSAEQAYRKTGAEPEESSNTSDWSQESVDEEEGSSQGVGRDRNKDVGEPGSKEEAAGTPSGETRTGSEEEESDPDQQAGDEVEQSSEERIALLEEDLSRTREGMLRKAAEFENLKKRTQKEKSHLFEDARIDAISKFLPIREDLKRSIDASKNREVDKGFLEGLKLVLQNFDRVLEQYHVELIEETGVPFDVDMHDAMLSQPTDENVDSNVILQVLEPGYKIGDRVIKHAKVIVSQ